MDYIRQIASCVKLTLVPRHAPVVFLLAALSIHDVTTEPAAKPGAYRFTDHSVLRPWVTRVWFARLFPLLPRWLAANLVTLMSTGTLVAIVGASLAADWMGPVYFALLQLGALQLYVAGDHLDGMQAVASGTTSPLGDFLDHHCDLWAGCVLCLGFWSLPRNAPLWELYLLTVLLITGFAITYLERAERKALHFTAWGTLEAIAILTAFYLSWCFAPARAWWNGELFGGVARHFLPAVAGMAMAIGAILIIGRRLRVVPAPLILSTTTLVALAAWCVRAELPPLWGWLVVALTGADYVALVMQAHTTARARPWPDFVPPVATAALWAVSAVISAAPANPNAATAPRALLISLTIWLLVRYAVTLTRTISGWRRHWVWKNEAPVAVP